MTQHQNRLLNFFVLFSALIAFYIGFRMPNLWSLNYYIPSVFDGFYRRSLVGTLLHIFGGLRFDYYFIVGLQLSVFIALLGIIFRYTWHASIPLKIMVILFFLAPTGGYFFHEIGYIDQLLYLFLFGVLSLSNKALKLGLITASLFIHEEALFTIIPIYFAYLVISKESIKYIAVNIVVIALTFLMLFIYLKGVPQTHITTFINTALSSVSYKFRTDYYIIFNPVFLKSQTLKIHYNEQLYFSLSCALAMSVLIGCLFSDGKLRMPHNALRFLCVTAACVSPLLLGVIGVDTSRWIFLAFSSALIMIFLHKSTQQTWALYSIIFVFMLFARFGTLEYFDNYAPRAINEPARIVQFWKHEFGQLISTLPVR